MRNNKLNVSINTDWYNKPEKRISASGKPFLINADQQRVNLSEGWKPHQATVSEVFDILTVYGHPVAPVLKDNYRTSNNFISHSLLLIDIDETLTLNEIVAKPFYQSYAAGYYATPSYTPSKPRFRIIFVLEEDITDAKQMVHLYSAVMQQMGETVVDTTCKDASRLFYGTKDCQVKYLDSSKYLSAGVVEQLIPDYKKTVVEYVPTVKAYDYAPPSDIEKTVIVELLRTIDINDYDKWLSIGYAFKSQGFSCQDWIYATNEQNITESEYKWPGLKPTNNSMGSVINIIKSHHGNAGLDAIRLAKAENDKQNIAAKLARLNAKRRSAANV
jgi:hypothetical protein